MHSIKIHPVLLILTLVFLESPSARCNIAPELMLREFYHLDSICSVVRDNDAKLVLAHSRQMLGIARQLQVDSLVLKANILQAKALDVLAIFDAALKVHYENLLLAESLGNCIAKAATAESMGRDYQYLNDANNALNFMQKAKAWSIDCGLTADTVMLNYEIGFDLVMLGKTDSGIRLIEDNLKTARKSGNREHLLYGIDNLANLLFEIGDRNKAIALFMELPGLMGDWSSMEEKTGVYEHLAEMYVQEKQWDKAQLYLDTARQHAIQLNSNNWLFEIFKLQSAIDESQGRYKSALENHQKYLNLKDSVYQEQYHNKVSAMTALYELKNKEHTIALLEKDKFLQSEHIRFQRILIIAGLLAIAVLILWLVFRNLKKINGLRAEFSRELIQTQEGERQRISRELHDSVGQNLLFIKNRINRLTPEPDVQLSASLDEALHEVRVIAKDLYPNQLEKYGLNAAVSSLCEQAQETSPVFISCDLEGIDEKLSKESKINLYRGLQECLNNALKHAGATAIRISSATMAGGVSVMVQDNGKGFDKSLLKAKSARSSGLLNMEERMHLLNGRFEMETFLNQGSKFTFHIPVTV